MQTCVLLFFAQAEIHVRSQDVVRYAIEANIIIDTIKQQLSSVDQYSIHIADYSLGLFEFSLTCIAVNPSLGGITQIFRVFY